jgi:heme iron utilization protein
MAALATLSDDGSPWCSLVLYAPLPDGTPVLCLSALAEHGRNLVRDPRASLLVGDADPTLAGGRVTLAGRVEAPDGDELERARAAYRAVAPDYGELGDFTYYVLCVERVRWVGGYGRMASPDAASYHAAE